MCNYKGGVHPFTVKVQTETAPAKSTGRSVVFGRFPFLFITFFNLGVTRKNLERPYTEGQFQISHKGDKLKNEKENFSKENVISVFGSSDDYELLGICTW